MYDELVKRLREEASEWCSNCCYRCGDNVCGAPDNRKNDCDIASKLQAADAIEELSKPCWIPVESRLPENDSWYLVYAPNYRGGSSSGLKCVDGKMFCKFAKGKWSIEHGYYNRPGCVTHWMPLPQPPKEET